MARKRRKAQRLVVVLLSDTHAGHKLGLISPGVQLYEQDEQGGLYRYTPPLTKTQQYLWNVYISDTAQAATFADGDSVLILHCGDATHGKAYPDQLVSTRMANQILIAVANTQALFDNIPNANMARFVQGTGSHEFGEGSSPILIVDKLKSEYPERDIEMPAHGLIGVDGCTIDYAHHGPGPGSRNWLRGNIARLYLRSLMMDDLDAGEMPPDVVVRGHFHAFVPPVTERISRGGTIYTSTLILLPSYCGLGDFARKVTRSPSRLSNGMVLLEVTDGKLTNIVPLVTTVDLRTKETF